MFDKDDRAASGIGELPGLVIGVVIALLFLGLLAPVGFNSFFAANTSEWNEDTIQVWEVLPIIVIIVILAAIAGVAIKSLPNN